MIWHNGSFFNEGQPSVEVQIFAGMQLGTIDLNKRSLRVRHVWYILLVECQTAPADNCFHRWLLLKIAPVFPSTPLKVQGCWGFSFVATGTYLSCCPASAVFPLSSLSFSVSSTHLDTDRLGNSSSWSSSDVGRLKHFGVRLSVVNSIWISPMWIVLTHGSILLIDPHDFKYQQTTRVKR